MKRLLLACLIGAATPSLTLAAGPGGGGVEVALDESVEELAQELGPPGEPPATDLEAAERARHISKGLRCPICQGSSIQDSPVESATNMRNRVREMASGAVLHVLATDPSTGRDFQNFCRFMGHELLAEERDGDRFEYWIRKG